MSKPRSFRTTVDAVTDDRYDSDGSYTKIEEIETACEGYLDHPWGETTAEGGRERDECTEARHDAQVTLAGRPS